MSEIFIYTGIVFSSRLILQTPCVTGHEERRHRSRIRLRLVPSARTNRKRRTKGVFRFPSVSPAIARLLLLLLSQTLERVAWYIVSINVRTYTRYCMGVTEESNGISIANIVSLLFVATTFLLSPLWAYACDRKLGHCKVLIVALIPYTIGGVFIYASSLYLVEFRSDSSKRRRESLLFHGHQCRRRVFRRRACRHVAVHARATRLQ